MIILRQRTYTVSIQNRIKSIKRHRKRAKGIATALKKLEEGSKELSRDDVKNLTVFYRTANTPGTKLAESVNKGKIIPLTSGEVDSFQAIHEIGEGATKSKFGRAYRTPSATAEINEIVERGSGPDSFMEILGVDERTYQGRLKDRKALRDKWRSKINKSN